MPISHLLTDSFYQEQQQKRLHEAPKSQYSNNSNLHVHFDENVTFHEEIAETDGGSESENVVLIDTDGGCYDAWALFLALASSEKNMKIVGITTVNGCTTVDNAVMNVSRVLQAIGKRIPVYKGADSALLGSSGSKTPRPSFFGSDGFGDPANLPMLAAEPAVEAEPAAVGIIKLAERYKGKLTILALGALTNMAMAVKLKPKIRNYIKEIFILGGNSEGVGNMTVSSEFNFFVDPEAAKIVLENFSSCPVYILPWETCLRSAASTYDFRMNSLGTLGTPAVHLLNKIEEAILSKFHDRWIAPDAVVVACFIHRQIMSKTEQYHCTVELHGDHTRGMMIVDKNFIRQKPANVILITEVQLEDYEKLLMTALGHQRHHVHDNAVTLIRSGPKLELAPTPYLNVNQNYF
ncbi:unnamed protein product [Orchesella dallaii]|uniref:Inosine/uridine-preferring nucleoside hydrolase domain-containing protein n=1 Tax=Orchesella dallaii TaxID=48710 RepID=A0ABP1RZF8_9HEXA